MKAHGSQSPNPTWVRLDNASNIFLAARSDMDPKVFRLSAEMDHDVDPVMLQSALNISYERYPLYQSVLRRGVFWYYLQTSALRPLVTEDIHHTCAPIYRADQRTLLFRVMYHGRRIILEVFHALSDGTGAVWFLTDLLTEYVRLRYPGDVWPIASETPEAHELTADSFAEHFGSHRQRGDLGFEDHVDSPLRTPSRHVYRVRGTRTPDSRTRAVELTMPVHDVLQLARAERVSLTAYLTALLMESVRTSSGGLGSRSILTASVPVNLRQFFPSTSARNFFATVRVHHTYSHGLDDVGSICRSIESQLRAKATQNALDRKVRRLVRFERRPILRTIVRPLKDVILRLINWGNNRGLSVAVSNLGRVNLPAQTGSHVQRIFIHISAVRPQICAISTGDTLTIGFSSPFTQTDHIRDFARILTANGIDISVAAVRVTEEELDEAPS